MALFELMRKYPDAPYYWSAISRYNPPADIIRMFESKWNWEGLSYGDVSIDTIREYSTLWNYRILSFDRDMEFAFANIDLPFNLNEIADAKFILANLHRAWNWHAINGRQIIPDILFCCSGVSIDSIPADITGDIAAELIVANPHLHWDYNEIVTDVNFILANDKPWDLYSLCAELNPADVRKLPQINWDGYYCNNLFKGSEIEESHDCEIASDILSMEFIVTHPNFTYSWYIVSDTEFIIANNNRSYSWGGDFDSIRAHYGYLKHPQIPAILREGLLRGIIMCESMEFLINNVEFAESIKWNDIAHSKLFTGEFALANTDKIDFSSL